MSDYKNGLISSRNVCLTGATASNAFVRVGKAGDVSVAGDLEVLGNATIDGQLLMDGADISNNANLIYYDISAISRPLFPGLVDITSAGTITKQTSATLVPESAFTIPVGFDGYYSFTAQILLGTVGTVADGENIQIYLDVSGGSLTPIAGTTNIIDMTENSANTFAQTPGGIIMQKLKAGDIIQLYHLEQGSYTFGSGSIQVAYTYLGNTAI
jgi:hypothetical protein